MDPTLEELINGRPVPAALPNVNPQGLTQAGSNMATMGSVPNQGQMTQPALNPQPQPPATPEEFNARKNGWMQMMQQLRADPSVQQAVMFTAARLLQGQKFGQSVGGALGEAAFGGLSMYNQLQENASEQQLKQREAERRDQLVGADIGLREAQTAESRQRTEESAAKAPVEIERLQNEAKRARLDAAIKSIELAVAQGVPIDAQVKQKLDKMKLELAVMDANRVKSLAAAGASSANAAWTRERAATEAETRPWEISAKASNATKAMHEANLAGMDVAAGGRQSSRGSTAAIVQGREDAYKRIASVHPDWRPDQINAEILRTEGFVKGKPDRQFLIDANKVWVEATYADPNTPSFDEWYEKMFGEPPPGGKKAAPAATPAPTGQRVIKYPAK